MSWTGTVGGRKSGCFDEKIGQGRRIPVHWFGICLCRGVECVAAHPGQEVQRREEHADAGGEEDGLLLAQSRPWLLRRSCRHRCLF
jgi:hypothetical protein